MPACDHCLLDVAETAAIRDLVDGREALFCCAGCRGVYRLLRREGLDGFYRRRRGWTPGPPEPSAQDPSAFADSVRADGDALEAEFSLSGIRCASCVWLVERYLGRSPGVVFARVNYATSRAKVRWKRGAIELEDILGRIGALGYSAHPLAHGAPQEALEREKKDLLLRFGTAAFLSMQVMTFTTGLYAGYFQGIERQYATLLEWLAFALTTPVIFYCGYPFLRGFLAGIRNRTAGMDALVFLGSFSAYAFSVVSMARGGEVYFDTSGMIVTLILLGRYLEACARGKASETIGRLICLAPRTARKVLPGRAGAAPSIEVVPASSLSSTDVIEVIPGERIPADGRVLEGASEADESMLTGEARPVPKAPGACVFAGTLNGGGRMHIEITGTGEETVLARIVRAVLESQSRKAPVQRVADKIVGYFVPAVVALSFAAFCVRLLSGAPTVQSLLASISVLVVACPCALGLATPLAVVLGASAAQSRGVLVRGGDVLETCAKATDVLIDKTGTLTTGRLRLTDVKGFGLPGEEVLRLAASLEAPSGHPFAAALLGRANRTDLARVEGFRAHPGLGVEGNVEGKRYLVGREELLASWGIVVRPDQALLKETLEAAGNTVAWLAGEADVLGLLAASDTLRGEAAETVARLRDDGFRVEMLTGDAEAVAAGIAREAGIGRHLSRAAPVEKAEFIRKKRTEGKTVLMAGDGINDAPALAEADIGVAMGRGTGVAIESAGAVLMTEDLRLLPDLLSLAKRTMRIVRQNLFWAFSYNMVAIPLAVSGRLHPILSAALMAASSLVVVGNSLRLRKG